MSETVKEKTKDKVPFISIYPPFRTTVYVIISIIAMTIVITILIILPFFLLFTIPMVILMMIAYSILYIIGVRKAIKLRRDLWFVHLLLNIIPGVSFVTASL